VWASESVSAVVRDLQPALESVSVLASMARLLPP